MRNDNQALLSACEQAAAEVGEELGCSIDSLQLAPQDRGVSFKADETWVHISLDGPWEDFCDDPVSAAEQWPEKLLEIFHEKIADALE